MQPYVFDLGKGYDGEVPVDNFAIERRDGVRIHLDCVGDRYLISHSKWNKDDPGTWCATISEALRMMADFLEES